MRAAIVGIAGPRLAAAEAALFRALSTGRRHPVRSQCREPGPAPVARRRAARRAAPARPAAGRPGRRPGRPAQPPHWRAHPPAGVDRRVFAERRPGRPARRLDHRRADRADCASAGFDVACAPVLDLGLAGAHHVIGDRSFGAGSPWRPPGSAARFAAGLLAAGVQPVGKHAPGHGRAQVDSHLALPRVEAQRSRAPICCRSP